MDHQVWIVSLAITLTCGMHRTNHVLFATQTDSQRATLLAWLAIRAASHVMTPQTTAVLVVMQVATCFRIIIHVSRPAETGII